MPCLGRAADRLDCWLRLEAGRLRESSDSIFLRIAWETASHRDSIVSARTQASAYRRRAGLNGANKTRDAA